MKVLYVKPMEPPEVVEIEDKLDVLQSMVGGLIEAFYPFDDDVAIICNDEGKLNNMPPNRTIWIDKEPVDVICGPFLIVGLGAENFDSLTEKQLTEYTNKFKIPEVWE